MRRRVTKPRIARITRGPMPWCALFPAHAGRTPQLAFCLTFAHAVQCLDLWLRWVREAPEPLLPAMPHLVPFRSWRPRPEVLN